MLDVTENMNKCGEVHVTERRIVTLCGIRTLYMYIRVTGCSWKVNDHPLDIDQATSQTAFILHDLKPYTTYAVYVQTYTIMSAKTGARSPILYFTTHAKSAFLHAVYCTQDHLLFFFKVYEAHCFRQSFGSRVNILPQDIFRKCI